MNELGFHRPSINVMKEGRKEGREWCQCVQRQDKAWYGAGKSCGAHSRDLRLEDRWGSEHEGPVGHVKDSELPPGGSRESWI